MNNSHALACAFSLSLLRAARLSTAATSRVALSLPFEEFGTPQEILDWYRETWPNLPAISEVEVRGSWAVISETALENIQPIFIGSDQYPRYLKGIEDPPPVLYVKGNLGLLASDPGVSVVGTRKASEAGVIIAERIARFFSTRQWTVVSGLALGIDAAAHRGALHGKGPTIAVLAHGLEQASPKANAKLGAEILEANGAWVSEYPIGVAARPEQFVLRNRIQIGLSAGSIIVEGEERSGTMTQAEFCLRNERQLFAVLPERADSLGLVSKGPLILINKRGATPLRSKGDYEAAVQALERKRAEIFQRGL